MDDSPLRDEGGEFRYPDEVLDDDVRSFDFINGKNRVWFGRLCSAEIGENDRSQVVLHDFDGETHSFEVPAYRVDEVRDALGRPIQATCWEFEDDDGNTKVVLYFMRRLSPFEVGPRKPQKSLRERGIKPMTLEELTPLLKDLFPTAEDAVRFGEELERLRGRKIYD